METFTVDPNVLDSGNKGHQMRRSMGKGEFWKFEKKN
jgi:hypothetical protein